MMDFGLILLGAFIGCLALYFYLRKSGRLPSDSGPKGKPGGGGGGGSSKS